MGIALSACISQLEPDDDQLRAGTCKSEDSDPEHYVQFEANLMPLFERSGSQGGCGCHMPGNRSTPGIDQSGLSLENYAALMRGGNSSRGTIVVPGDPCASVLLQKMTSAPPFGTRMPPSGPPFFTQQEMNLLSDWIFEGAHDN